MKAYALKLLIASHKYVKRCAIYNRSHFRDLGKTKRLKKFAHGNILMARTACISYQLRISRRIRSAMIGRFDKADKQENEQGEQGTDDCR